MASRRAFMIGGAAALGLGGYAAWRYALRPMVRGVPAEVGFDLTDDELAAARAFMAAHPIVDSHAHPGRTFLSGAENLSMKIRLYKLLGGAFEDETIADMAAGGVDAAVFDGVADIQLLTLGDAGLVAEREFAPGEAWASYQRQIANLRGLADRGAVALCLTGADVLAAKQAGRRGMVLGMEGADFLDGDVGRMADVARDGVRMITLVHYHDTEAGDIMFPAPTGARGLTAFGREVVAAMDAARITLDLAHASEKTLFGALDVATRPVVVSHSHINSPALTHPRFISPEAAQAVAATGGYIGAWPAGIGETTLAEFLDRIDFLVDAVGEDHVALGSDMDANYKPVLETYRKMPLVVGGLMRRGYEAARLAKIMGGNVLRVMDA